ncbi:MAG: nucleotidyl transferase AbiEii/AbiGii toxin family protein [Bacteriovoracaceae bacterium]|nr:nucleotidyl transferase AbiEii/AbiGii toxin family protein [Bacteriovoracaceae bacterium]
MDKFLTFPDLQRKELFEQAEATIGLAPDLLEKDFWVCWTLKELFSLEELKEQLTFKGGTSLSKVFNLIKRFSEDIDVCIEKKFLGVIGEFDPSNAASAKKAKALIEQLGDKCKEYVQGRLLNSLQDNFKKKLKGHDWKLQIGEEDNDGQTLLFYYPSVLEKKASTYVNRFIKLEFGARSEHSPSGMHQITSYLGEVYPQVLNKPEIEIRVLDAERTFWEKATILHKYAHYPIEKVVPARQSRHYYDFYCLLKSAVKEKAQSDLNLLKRVTEHNDIYFKATWANYLTAKKGSLKLIPGQRVLDDMRRDYRSMESMLFGEIPTWENIIKTISDFESAFNTIS